MQDLQQTAPHFKDFYPSTTSSSLQISILRSHRCRIYKRPLHTSRLSTQARQVHHSKFQFCEATGAGSTKDHRQRSCAEAACYWQQRSYIIVYLRHWIGFVCDDAWPHSEEGVAASHHPYQQRWT